MLQYLKLLYSTRKVSEDNMYEVIPNETYLEKWLNHNANEVKEVFMQEEIRTQLQFMVRMLDENYGADRDLEKNLGGYVIIIYGNKNEVEQDFQRVLLYHHLKKIDREYQDHYEHKSSGKKVDFWLFLCSSDYAVIVITIW